MNDGEYDSFPAQSIAKIVFDNTPPVYNNQETSFTVTKNFNMTLDVSSANDDDSSTRYFRFFMGHRR